MVLFHHYMKVRVRMAVRAVAAVGIGPEVERKTAVVQMLAEGMVFVVVAVLIGSRRHSTMKAFRMHREGQYCCCNSSHRWDHLGHRSGCWGTD